MRLIHRWDQPTTITDTAGTTLTTSSSSNSDEIRTNKIQNAFPIVKHVSNDPFTTLYPQQWIKCDLRYL